MTTVHYAISVIPDAHKVALNRLMAWVQEEDILASQNLSQPANGIREPPADPQNPSDPEDPNRATHWFGGRLVDEAWLALYQTRETPLPTPAGGWPLRVDETGEPVTEGGTIVLTQQEATDALDALVIQVTTGEWWAQMPSVTLAAALGALDLHKIIWPDE